MTKELNINGLLQMNDPFQDKAPGAFVFPNTDTFPKLFFLLAGICVSAQKLSRFADWLELSCCFLNCCSLQPILVEKNLCCSTGIYGGLWWVDASWVPNAHQRHSITPEMDRGEKI